MSNNLHETNIVEVTGKIVSPIEFSHELYGEGFYNFYLEVPRLSETVDILPVTISERLIINLDLKEGKYVKIFGQLRSYNRYIDGASKLVLTIFSRDIKLLEDEKEIKEELKSPNEIFLDGYICKPPVYRTTPFGREISDLLLAVNRAYNKSDYIPCIAWGRNARFCDNILVGDHLKIWGRIQSREYQKKIKENEYETRVAYEVSISKLEYIENDNNRMKVSEEEA
ncbi:MAG: single-stranded DNA-binding protein [Tissierellia bacterium]|nr:single-stranded DNA-binding protein [Tissierellia bacterium]